MAPHDPAPRIDTTSRRGEHPLPAPFPRCAWILASERTRQRDLPEAKRTVLGVECADPLQMDTERPPDRARQRHHPILAALAVAHADLAGVEVEVLHPERERLEESK